MPFIIKNGKYYGSGGGSGDSSIDITQAEYDKLEASGKVNHDVTYYITDGVYEEGEGNTNIVKLTQVEYDALGDEKLSDNNIYLITDADELSAENLFYDDTETGFGVNNVQDAIVEQNKNLTWKLAGSASKNNLVSLSGISYEEVLIYVTNDSDGDGKAGWYDTSLVVPKVALINRQIINMPAYNHNESDHLYCVCWYGNQTIGIYVHAIGDRSVLDNSTLYVYYR